MNNTSSRSMSRILLLVFLAVIFGIALYFVLQKKLSNVSTSFTSVGSNPVTSPVPSQIPKTSNMSLSLNTSQKIAVGTPFTVFIDASSKGEDIVGYDTVIEYDQSALEYVSATSSQTEFQIFQRVNNNIVAITGTKQVQIKTPTVFVNSHLVAFTFKPKKKGLTQISIRSNVGKLKSQLIDNAIHSSIASDFMLPITIQN